MRFSVSSARLKPVRIGCSGWNYKHFREVVYPKARPKVLKDL